MRAALVLWNERRPFTLPQEVLVLRRDQLQWVLDHNPDANTTIKLARALPACDACL